ncbi:ribonuclease H-like domain-containing protein [Tanacetum coccineum]
MVVFMLSYSIRVMDPNSSLGKICLGENVVEISSDKVEGSGDWNSPKFQDTANSGQKKETKAMVFYQMDTKEVSDRFVAPCFVNGLEAYDGEINFGVEENMISNEYAVKLCLEHEVKIGNKVVKMELIVALRGEIYFVKFIINPEEDDVEPEVILGKSFLRMTKAIADFRAGTIIIYPDIDLFLEDIEEEEKRMDDWDQLLDFNLDDIPLLGEKELPPFVCKMGKSSRNKKRAMENLNLFYQDIGTSSSAGGHLTQEEAAKEALAIRISQKFALLEEVRPVIETMAYHDKYKKALKEKDDLGAFIFPIILEGKVNENALADTGSDINTMSYQIYETLGREEMKKVDRGITMINHTQAEAMGILTNILCQVGVTTLIAKFLILDILIERDAPIVVGRGFMRTIGGIVNTPERLFSTFDGFCHQTFRVARSDVIRNAKSDSDDEEEFEIKRNKFRAPIYGLKPIPYLNCNDPAEQSLALQTIINPFRKISVWKKVVSFLGSLPTIGTHDDEAGSSRSKRSRQHETLEEDVLNRMGCDGEIDDMLGIKLREAESNEEIFTSVAWIRAFNINEPIYAELCHELGLYHADELEEDGFNVYFEGGLCSDEHFNAQEYWLSISKECNNPHFHVILRQ